MEKLDKKVKLGWDHSQGATDSDRVPALVKVKDGSIIPEDSWMVFYAQDSVFAEVALPAYFAGCIRAGCDSAQIEAVQRLIENVNRWREAHPDQCKVPDAANEEMLG